MLRSVKDGLAVRPSRKQFRRISFLLDLLVLRPNPTRGQGSGNLLFKIGTSYEAALFERGVPTLMMSFRTVDDERPQKVSDCLLCC